MTVATSSNRAAQERLLLLLRERKRRRPWAPLPGPQTMAWESEADVIGFGGAAGGGKTDLACGKALLRHQRTMILRREATQLTGIVDRLTELLGGRDGYNGQERVWRLAGRQIEFGSTPNPGDETKYQGRPHDLLVFDEATNFLEQMVRFLLGWLRTTTPGQRCQALLTFNPPTTAEGRWVIAFFAPWLDPKHPNPARPGELRWFATVDGQDEERPNGDPFEHNGETIKPMSRTFIPSRVTDNPHLMGTGYMAQLQSLPEPLRSQMLYGDFNAGVEDDPWQIIPTAWVDAAMARWRPRDKRGRMDSMGVDVARGGQDETVIARRHEGMWFDEPIAHPGKTTPDGDATAGLVVAARRDRAPIHIDIIGWGASAYDSLKHLAQTVGINNSTKSASRTQEGNLPFANLRAEVWWRMREALDPKNDTGIALPNDPRLRGDLCAPKWLLRSGAVLVEDKEEVKARIGRSPDRGDAYCLANIDTLRDEDAPGRAGKTDRRNYDPYAKR